MYLFFILLLGICLCLSVNSFLNGAIKAQIFIIGNILALIFVELSFYFYDWQIGCTAIVVYLGVGITLKPLGANIAAWILRKAFQVEGEYIGLPPYRLKKISQKINAHMSRSISISSLLEVIS